MRIKEAVKSVSRLSATGLNPQQCAMTHPLVCANCPCGRQDAGHNFVSSRIQASNVPSSKPPKRRKTVTSSPHRADLAGIRSQRCGDAVQLAPNKALASRELRYKFINELDWTSPSCLRPRLLRSSRVVVESGIHRMDGTFGDPRWGSPRIGCRTMDKQGNLP